MVDAPDIRNVRMPESQELVRGPPASIRNNARKARVQGYRLRAEELRVISTEVVLPETKTTLLDLADCYDQMATGLENAHYV